MRIQHLYFAAFLLLTAATGADAKDYKIGDLTITQEWSRATPPAAEVAAGYLTITNRGSAPDKLVSVDSDISGMAMIHQMSMNNGVMTMEEVKGGLPLPAGGTVVLKPGSFHVMFMSLKHPLKQGDTFTADLTFEKAGKVTVEFAVGSVGAQTAPGS